MPADARELGVGIEESHALLKESNVQHHVAVEEVEVAPTRMLESELCSRSAAPFLRVPELDDADGKAPRDIQRAIG
jgi:hypothetical protein